MLHFDLVSILFGTSIPTSFNILVKMFLHLFIICHNVVLPDLVFPSTYFLIQCVYFIVM